MSLTPINTCVACDKEHPKCDIYRGIERKLASSEAKAEQLLHKCQSVHGTQESLRGKMDSYSSWMKEAKEKVMAECPSGLDCRHVQDSLAEHNVRIVT